MQIKYFKMFSGEEVIAKARKVGDSWYMEDPAMIIHLQEYKLGLANWLPYTKVKDGANIPDSAIMFCTDVADDMVQYYGTWCDPDLIVDQDGAKMQTESV
jgi:hypothetical protein